MILSQDKWERVAKGFRLFDCCFVSRTKFAFLLKEEQPESHEDDESYHDWEDYLRTRLLVAEKLDDGPHENAGGREFQYSSFRVSADPETEEVILLSDRGDV